MPHPPKPWKSYSEQLEILCHRGMLFSDEDIALKKLSQIGYYRLSGYWYPFKEFDFEEKKANDKFKSDTYFEDVVALYEFDRKLRLLAMDALERIELAIQVEVAHLLGEKNSFAHTLTQYFDTSYTKVKTNGQINNYDLWQAEYQKLIKRSEQKEFVKHNCDTYGDLSIWVAVEIFDFGTLSKLFSYMRHNDKLAIEKKYGFNTGRVLQTWLRSFNFVRNTSAHHNRLWNCNIVERPIIPVSEVQLKQLNNSRPFLYFCMMQKILNMIMPNCLWKQSFLQLMSEFPTPRNNAISIDNMGTIPNWENWRLWKNNP